MPGIDVSMDAPVAEVALRSGPPATETSIKAERDRLLERLDLL